MNKLFRSSALLAGLALSSLISIGSAQAEPTAEDAHEFIRQLIAAKKLRSDSQEKLYDSYINNDKCNFTFIHPMHLTKVVDETVVSTITGNWGMAKAELCNNEGEVCLTEVGNSLEGTWNFGKRFYIANSKTQVGLVTHDPNLSKRILAAISVLQNTCKPKF